MFLLLLMMRRRGCLVIDTPGFSEFSEKEWDEVRQESLRTGEAMQFIAKRKKEKQKTLVGFK